ncbi:retrovirus-related pol polyprotein from transposon TNT 1-94 [Tanacetum coccineum]
MEPGTSRGSDTSVAPSSSSLIDCRLSKLFCGIWTPDAPSITGDSSQLTNFVHKFLGVYYVEGLGHNLFLVGQFCDSDLEVAFRKHTCFVRNLEGDDLLSRSRGTNLYSLSIGDMMASSLICLLSKATKTKSWLWHRRLSHLNFGALNHMARNGLVHGLPRLKFEKDHLCSACAMGKSKKQSYKPKSKDTNQEKLYLLHMDLCGPMRVANVNGKKYILVIVDDYSRFTWVKFLASKDEAPNFIIKFLKMIQVGISHETLVARTPQQNGAVERVALSGLVDHVFLRSNQDVFVLCVFFSSTPVTHSYLDEFKHASGLIPSIPKSTDFFCNVLNHVKLSILNVLPFEEGRLPVKYLGVPLVSSRLKARDCKELVEKVQNRVLDWKNKALSIAAMHA